VTYNYNISQKRLSNILRHCY